MAVWSTPNQAASSGDASIHGSEVDAITGNGEFAANADEDDVDDTRKPLARELERATLGSVGCDAAPVRPDGDAATAPAEEAAAATTALRSSCVGGIEN